MTRNQKLATGAGVGVLLALGYYYFGPTAQAAGIPTGPTEEPPPTEEPGGQLKGAGKGATRVKIPAKVGTARWNQSLFPNTKAVQGLLATLSPRYAGASTAEGFAAATLDFQRNWNDLSKLDALVPARLNGTTLLEDNKAGGQTLRGLEWALGMDWPTRLAEFGIGV